MQNFEKGKENHEPSKPNSMLPLGGNTDSRLLWDYFVCLLFCFSQTGKGEVKCNDTLYMTKC